MRQQNGRQRLDVIFREGEADLAHAVEALRQEQGWSDAEVGRFLIRQGLRSDATQALLPAEVTVDES